MRLEVRREQVLDATLRLVTRHGYAAITMESGSLEAELAEPRVQVAYSGEEPLPLALSDRGGQRVLATLSEAMPVFTADRDFDDILVRRGDGEPAHREPGPVAPAARCRRAERGPRTLRGRAAIPPRSDAICP